MVIFSLFVYEVIASDELSLVANGELRQHINKMKYFTLLPVKLVALSAD